MTNWRDQQALTIRLDADVYLQLRERAAGQGRTIARQVEAEIKKSLKRKAA